MFCTLVGEVQSITNKVAKIRKDETICNVEQAILEDHVILIFEPEDYGAYFLQMELLIATIEELYGRIEPRKRHFREEDWEKVENRKKQFEDLKAQIRYEEWEKGYRTI